MIYDIARSVHHTRGFAKPKSRNPNAFERPPTTGVHTLGAILMESPEKWCCFDNPVGTMCFMAKYPIFLELEGRRAVVVGGGAVAVRKAASLLEAGARLIVVAHKPGDAMTTLCTNHGAELIRDRYAKPYIGEAVLVIAATDDAQVNEQVYRDCQELEILCNVVDDPQHCDFFVPALVKRGDLQIAIGTGGYSPAYAGHLRQRLETLFTEEHGRFLVELESIRREIIEEVPSSADRKSLMGNLVDDESFEYFRTNGPEAWRERARDTIKARTVKT
jgi:precorrin-2 dehydrogenase/sirohydrochlorin ferrochelatase